MKQTLKYLIFLAVVLASIFYFAAKNCSSQENRNAPGIELVVIDPGHGGRDFGAVYGKFKEKDIVLDIALKLGNYIRSRFPETKVIYTRDQDVFVPLHRRADIANQNKADLFISIHVNYVNSGYVQGAETFVLGEHRSEENLEVAKKENAVILLEDDYNTTYEGFDPNSPESYIMFELVQDEYLEQSVEFASDIQNEFKNTAKRKDRSVKQAGFLVLRRTTMPGVLVEAGFISHASERSFMISEEGKIKLATAIFNAFKHYKKKIENSSSFQLVTESPQIEPEPNTQQLHGVINNNLKGDDKSNIFFSVQLAALSKNLAPIPENFRGETGVFQLNSGAVYRYLTGKFSDYQNAEKEKIRLQSKFNGAFVVAVENGKLISVKKAMRKM